MNVRATLDALRNALARRAAVVRRSRLGAWIDAEIAVRAEVSLQHHLEQRLATYAMRRPAVLGEPWSIGVHDGAVLRADGRLDPREAVLADPAGVDASFEDAAEATRVRATRATLDAQRGYFARELATRQERLDRVEARRQQLDDDEVALRGALDGDLHTGRAIPTKTQRRGVGERGRPALRGVFDRAVLRAILAAMLFGESLQVYPVMADAMGVNPDLLAAIGDKPFTALLALVAAAVAVCALFAVFEGAMMLVGRALAPGRALVRAVNLVGAAGALGAFLGGAWAIAVLRERALATTAQEQAERAMRAVATAAVPVWVTFAFTAVVSMGAAWIYAKIEEITAKREAAREAQRAWDEAQSLRVEVRERAEERLAQTLGLRAENERAMAAERRAVEALELEARAAEAALAESVAQDRARMMAWLTSAEAALLTDRTMFSLVATRRGREDLLRGVTVESGMRRIVREAPLAVSRGVR